MSDWCVLIVSVFTYPAAPSCTAQKLARLQTTYQLFRIFNPANTPTLIHMVDLISTTSIYSLCVEIPDSHLNFGFSSHVVKA